MLGWYDVSHGFSEQGVEHTIGKTLEVLRRQRRPPGAITDNTRIEHESNPLPQRSIAVIMTPIKTHQIRMRPAHLNHLRRTGDAVLINNLETSQPSSPN